MQVVAILSFKGAYHSIKIVSRVLSLALTNLLRKSILVCKLKRMRQDQLMVLFPSRTSALEKTSRAQEVNRASVSALSKAWMVEDKNQNLRDLSRIHLATLVIV